MADNMENKNQHRKDDEARLVDIFQDETIWKSGNGNAEKVENSASADYEANSFEDTEDEIEERDYRPIRFRRDGRIGCLGGLMYAVFVISLSIICACGAWR